MTSTTGLTSDPSYMVLSPQTLDEKTVYTEEELHEYEQELANEAGDLHKKTEELQKQREELQRKEEELKAEKLGLQQVKSSQEAAFFPQGLAVHPFCLMRLIICDNLPRQHLLTQHVNLLPSSSGIGRNGEVKSQKLKP